MVRKLVPEEDYRGKEPDYIPDGTIIDHHVDGESWGKFRKGVVESHKIGGWCTSKYDQYYYDPDAPITDQW